MNKKKLSVILITIAFIGAGGILYHMDKTGMNHSDVIITNKEEDESNVSDKNTSINDEEAADGTAASIQPSDTVYVSYVYVHVCGEVKNPNVYKLKQTAHIIDAIKSAGGLTKEAAGDYINQAELVYDGQKIYIPSKKEVENEEGDWKEKTKANQENENTQGDSDVILVNINEASVEDLMTLPGIGQVKADSIISYREKNNGFDNVEDIMNIEGIKEGVFNKIQDFITIN